MDLLDYALLILRLVVGLLFAGHGAQKLFGWFGGHGIEGTSGFFGSLGVKPPRLWAAVAGLSEFLGGLGLAFGLLTPLAAAVVIGVMLVAVIKVHWQKGIWNTNGGVEFPLVMAAVAFVAGLLGPGAYSLDAVFGLDLPRPTTFFYALSVVIVGVILSLFSAQELPERQHKHRTTEG